MITEKSKEYVKIWMGHWRRSLVCSWDIVVSPQFLPIVEANSTKSHNVHNQAEEINVKVFIANVGLFSADR